MERKEGGVPGYFIWAAGKAAEFLKNAKFDGTQMKRKVARCVSNIYAAAIKSA